MKKAAMLILVTLLVAACSGGSTSDDAVPAAPAAEPVESAAGTGQTLTGEFIWTQPEDGPVTGEIEAVFEETAPGEYDVVFNFEWEGEAKTWTGKAQGSLMDGGLQGEVMDDTEENTFTFQGMTAGGKFTGTHAYNGEDGAEDTGTITLSS